MLHSLIVIDAHDSADVFARVWSESFLLIHPATTGLTALALPASAK
jgi:hypothetical protein